METPCLIVVCGLPATGKTTLAKGLSQMLRVHHIDIDDVRRLTFGLPDPHPDQSPELMIKDAREMKASYEIMFRMAKENLAVTSSVIITATFSRRSGQTMAEGLVERYHARLRVVWCVLEDDSRHVVEPRLVRDFGNDHAGAVNSYARYLEVKQRYEPIYLPHLRLDTSLISKRRTVEQAFVYVQTLS